MRLGRLIWGLLIVLFGILLLGTNLGWWDMSVWNRLVDLWPLILIILGIGIVFQDNNPVGLILILIVVLFGISYAANYRNIRNRIIRHTTAESVANSNFSVNLDPAVNSANIKVDFGAGNIRIDKTSDTTKLYTGSLISGRNLKTKTDVTNGIANVDFSEDFGNFSFFHFDNSTNKTGERAFNLSLTDQIPLTLDINTGASSLDLNLSSLKVTSLDVNAGASSGDIRIGSDEDKVDMTLDAGASKTTIYIPNGYAISVKSNSAMMTNNFSDIGLSKSGDTYQSSDFSSSQKQITMTVSAGASTININRY